MGTSVSELLNALRQIYRSKDRLWLLIWLGGMGALWMWDAVFLNAPALSRLQSSLLNSLFTGATAVALSLTAGCLLGIVLDRLEHAHQSAYVLASILINAIRSIPQVLMVLAGYVILTILVNAEIVGSSAIQLLWISMTIALAIFLEVADTVRTRIEHFRTLDFVDAMLCCGVSEWRIIVTEILWRNSRSHLLHKLIALFGVALFLQSSVDFIVSVGLSTDVSLSNVPQTLGTLLATLDSKQDILAVSNLFTDPWYFSVLAVRNLQGISVAFCIVFTLICVYRMANGFVRRHKLA
jgi:ABC-type dipeptide/oligopeptide/nickel transport system permease subunit